MRQPVLVIMDVPDGTDKAQLGAEVESVLRSARNWGVEWAIPLSYTLDVPEGAITP